MKTRRNVLEDLLFLREPLPRIHTSLAQFPWDSHEELVFLNRHHILSVLSRYMDSSVDENVVEAWANLIEGRDDIGFDAPDEEKLKSIIFELANPLLTVPLTRLHAQAIINSLE